MAKLFNEQWRLAARRYYRGVGLTVVALATGMAMLPRTAAAPPSWWLYRDVLNGQPADDHAVFNQGQLKNAVAACVDEMNDKLSGGAGTALNGLVAAWRDPMAVSDNYSVVNLGQLKAVTKLIYDRLNEVHGTPGYYPWNGGVADDYAAANQGQLKNVLNLDVTVPPNTHAGGGTGGLANSMDTDQDGLPDWFEILIGTDPTKRDSDNDGIPDGLEDHDNDGISNLAEFLAGTHGSGGTDTDGDGLNDDDEVALGTSPTLTDTDGDGVSDADEQALGTDPTDVNSTPWVNLQITTPLR